MDVRIYGARCPLCLRDNALVAVDNGTVGCVFCRSLMHPGWVLDRIAEAYGKVPTSPVMNGWQTATELEMARRWRAIINERQDRSLTGYYNHSAACAVRVTKQKRGPNGRFQGKAGDPPPAKSVSESLGTAE